MVSLYMIYFSLLSVVGYFYECIAMTFWAGKWDNRGFLFGPAIPIYGTGALLGTLLFTYIYTDYTPLTVFLVSMAASAVLEYVVHYVLEKIFHA
ncbi:MAG: putative ABC transporter permease, partial [Erysipelotrichaceae bacterium]|nr:putative ABC transporter permease [Erysipelotrichaceae bacterium]